MFEIIHVPMSRFFKKLRLGFIASLAAMSMLLSENFASGGTFRYDLPELLGEYRFDGGDDYSKRVEIDTPFNLTGVSRAIFFIEGSITPGVARGDGVVFEPDEFELVPSFYVFYGFPNSGFLTFPVETHSPFRINETFTGPFYSVTPLPNPVEPPPVFSFQVRPGAGPAISTLYPDHVDPNDVILNTFDAIVIETPIIAHVTEAYVILTGNSVVPEPHACFLLFCGTGLISVSIVRRFRT